MHYELNLQRLSRGGGGCQRKFLIIIVFLVTRLHPEAVQEPLGVTSLDGHTHLSGEFQGT